MKLPSGFCLLNCKIAMKCEKERRLTELWSGVEGLVKTIERVAMKRRKNMAETKIWEEKKLRRLNPPRQNPPPPSPPRLPLTATAESNFPVTFFLVNLWEVTLLLALRETKHFLGKYERGGRDEEKRDVGAYQKFSVQCQSHGLHHFGKNWISTLSYVTGVF